MTENIKYGIALKTLREARGLSARELSECAGLPDYVVSRVETGKLNLDFSTAVALTGQLGVSLDLLASTAATLPSTLLEHEAQLAQARKETKELRRKSRALRLGGEATR